MLDLQKQILPYLSHIRSIPAHLKHEFYDQTIAYRDSLAEVFSEKYPSYLDKTRPREREEHRQYRKEIYINPFRHLPNRMSESFDYIRQADDFDVAFPPLPDGLNPELSLEVYTGPALTPDGNLTDWFFNNCVDPYLLDPNACLAMVLTELPERTDFAETGLMKPQPMLFPSDHVLMHRKGKFAVLQSPEKYIYEDEFGIEREGDVLHFFDHESYTAAFEVGRYKSQNDTQEEIEWRIIGYSRTLGVNELGEIVSTYFFEPIRHHFQGMPVRKLGKRRTKYNAKREEFFESLLADAIPKIKEAQQIQSDIQVERNFHVTSTEWRDMSSVPKCKHPQCTSGYIYIKDAAGNNVNVKACPSCKGTGLHQPSGSNLEVLWINRSDTVNIGSVKPATTDKPGGYIEKSIEPIKQLAADYKEVSKQVYTTINMQFIEQVPLEISGASKRYDREEMYRELNTQAAHLLALLGILYKMADHLRYTGRAYVGLQAPDVLVPVRFNLENAELTREELNDAKLRNYDPALVHALEAKLLNYNTGTNADEYEQYMTRIRLDPYRDRDMDQKNMAMGVYISVLPDGEPRIRAVREVVYSLMFDALMTRAQNEHEDFYQKPLRERDRIMRGYLPEYFSGIREMPVDPSMAGKAGASGLPQFSSYTIKPQVDLQNRQQIEEQQDRAGY